MEIFDIVDKQGMPTGLTISRQEAHRTGVLHRTAHVWIIRFHNGKTQVLLQKRSDSKDSYPGCWDTSSAGHIPASQEPLPSALRELKEELGIEAQPEDLKEAGTFRIRFQEVFHGSLFDDNEIAFVYVYTKPVDTDCLILQKEEVSAAAWFDLDEVNQRVLAGDPAICADPRGIECLLDYLKTHQ